MDFEVGRDRRARRGKRERKSAVLPTRQPAFSNFFRFSAFTVSCLLGYSLLSSFPPKNHPSGAVFRRLLPCFGAVFCITNPTLFFYNCFMSKHIRIFQLGSFGKNTLFLESPVPTDGPSPLARPRFLIGVGRLSLPRIPVGARRPLRFFLVRRISNNCRHYTRPATPRPAKYHFSISSRSVAVPTVLLALYSPVGRAGSSPPNVPAVFSPVVTLSLSKGLCRVADASLRRQRVYILLDQKSQCSTTALSATIASSRSKSLHELTLMS